MKNTQKLLIASVLASASVAVSAEGLYAGAGIAKLDIDSPNLSFTTLEGKIGYQFSPYFAVEGQLGFGISDESLSQQENFFLDDDSVIVSEDVFNHDLEHYLGIYAKPQYAFSDMLSVYALLGLSYTSIEASSQESENGQIIFDGGQTTLSGTGFSYGIGAHLALSDQFGLEIEYKSLEPVENDNGVELGDDISGFSLGMTFNF